MTTAARSLTLALFIAALLLAGAATMASAHMLAAAQLGSIAALVGCLLLAVVVVVGWQ